MAVASARLAEYANGMAQVTLAYNDSSIQVSSFTLVNNSEQIITVTFTKSDDPNTVITCVLDPAPVDGSTIITIDQIGGGWYYSPVELEESDPDFGKPNVLVGFSDSPSVAMAAIAAGARRAAI